MNTLIAELHRMQRKFIGLIVACGGFFALGLSFLLIVSGITLTAILHPPTTDLRILIPYVIVWFFAALILGILIERLTTTNSTKLRIMREKVETIEENFARIEDPTEALKQKKDKDIKAATKGRNSIVFLIIFGTGLSMLGESFIIHFLFTSWNFFAGWAASLFFSSLVSYTLISSELHKKHESAVIHDSLDTDNFFGVAAHASIKESVHKSILAQSAVKVEEITESGVMLQAIDQAVIKHVDEVVQGDGEIVERIADEREKTRLRIEQEREKTREQLSDYGNGFKIIRDGGEPEPITSAVVASFNIPQPQKSKNYLKIEQMYKELGEGYFTENKKTRLSREMGISVRHVNRILDQVRKGKESA